MNATEADTTDGENAFENEITGDEAAKIIRSCCQHTPHLRPHSFPAYSTELYCDDGSAYTDLDGEESWIADNIGWCWTLQKRKYLQPVPLLGLMQYASS